MHFWCGTKGYGAHASNMSILPCQSNILTQEFQESAKLMHIRQTLNNNYRTKHTQKICNSTAIYKDDQIDYMRI